MKILFYVVSAILGLFVIVDSCVASRDSTANESSRHGRGDEFMGSNES